MNQFEVLYTTTGKIMVVFNEKQIDLESALTFIDAVAHGTAESSDPVNVTKCARKVLGMEN